MIGQEYAEQVVPLGRGLEFVDEIAKALVEIVEGIQLLVVEFLDGNVPGLMTAQCGVAHEETLGSVCLTNLIVECLEGDIISHTPFGGVLFFLCIVGFPMQLLPTSGYQVTTHIGEVDVAAIEIAGGIALMLQGTGDRGEMVGSLRHLHHRHGGEGWITAEGAHRTTIRTIAIAIAVLEGDTFPF